MRCLRYHALPHDVLDAVTRAPWREFLLPAARVRVPTL